MKTKNKKNRGTIVIWVAGILSTIVLSYSSLTTATLFRHSETNANQDVKISIVETQISAILKSQEKMERGIDEIKRILMQKDYSLVNKLDYGNY